MAVNNPIDNNENPVTARFPDVVTGLIIFLSINFLVAGIYFGIINP
jgi:hypothetical protein